MLWPKALIWPEHLPLLRELLTAEEYGELLRRLVPMKRPCMPAQGLAVAMLPQLRANWEHADSGVGNATDPSNHLLLLLVHRT